MNNRGWKSWPAAGVGSMAVLAVVGWLALATGEGVTEASAQRCPCAPTQCAATDRDGRGCCPTRFCEAREDAPATRPRAEPERGSQTACPAGMTQSVDTEGHCCWPRQAWSSGRSACVGTPSCPPAFEAHAGGCRAQCGAEEARVGEACQCAGGRERSEDTDGRCCWPGQVWSESRGVCVGEPTRCPEGRQPVGDACAAACSPGVMEQRAQTMRALEVWVSRGELQLETRGSAIVATLPSGVIFSGNRPDVLPTARRPLGGVGEVLRGNPEAPILVEVHTDNAGRDESNEELSLRRAEAARRFLIAQGVAENRIRAVGRGEGSPLVPNDTAENRARNRRVEIHIGSDCVAAHGRPAQQPGG